MLMFKYEEENVLDNEIIVEYMNRRKVTIIELFGMLQELNLPTKELYEYMKEKGINKKLSKQ